MRNKTKISDIVCLMRIVYVYWLAVVYA